MLRQQRGYMLLHLVHGLSYWECCHIWKSDQPEEVCVLMKTWPSWVTSVWCHESFLPDSDSNDVHDICNLLIRNYLFIASSESDNYTMR